MKNAINISTEAFDEIQTAMKAAGMDTQPDKLIINRDVTIRQPIDFRLATIRRDCLVEAVKVTLGTDFDTTSVANKMYDFVIGKE